MNPILKIAITVALIIGIAEVAKRSTLMGAILASIPLVSVLAMTWLYVDTKDLNAVSQLSMGIFWLVIPSLILFVSFPLLVKLGWSFALSLLGSCALTVLGYFAMIWVLKQCGIEL